MSDPELSEVDGDKDEVPTRDVLNRWSKKQLQDWLTQHHQRKSGNKPVLISRVLRCMNFGSDDSGSDDTSESESDLDEIPSFDSLEDWQELTTEKCPPVREEDITNYFIYAKNPVTGKPKKCKKQLKNARKFCNQHYVYDVEVSDIQDSAYCYVRAKCEPSMKDTVIVKGIMLDHYLLHVLLIKSTGKVETSNCGCKAGLPGVCSHVSALLLTMVKIHSACTSFLCEWKKPREVKKLSPKILRDIVFVNPEHDKEVPIKAYPGVYQAGPCCDPDSFFQDIMKDLGNVNPSCVLYQTLNPDTTDISGIISKYTPIYVFRDSVDLTSIVCQSRFIDFCNQLEVTQEEISRVNKATKGQRVNMNWKEIRKFILTASNFGSICKRRDSTAPDNLIKQLRGYTPSATNAAIRYGQNKESKARRDYARYHMKACGGPVNIEEQGLILSNKFPFLGASVDGKVMCKKCGTGVIEIKCPYKWRNRTPQDCAQERDFCSAVVNGELELKMNHNYMYQIMGQMAVLESPWVDFVIWTKKGMSVQRIQYNDEFWQQNMLFRLKTFYCSNFAAELFSHRIKRQVPLFK